MKAFQPFRLDTVNHCLWRAEKRVPLTPKAFDVLRYLVEHAERLASGRLLYLWPREKACQNIRQRTRDVVRSFPSNGRVDLVIQKLNPILNGCCTYFRVGNSNRTFHKVDWAVRSELQLWLRRKHQCPWRTAKKRWGYHFFHERCRLTRMVGKVSHLEGLRRTPPSAWDWLKRLKSRQPTLLPHWRLGPAVGR